MPRPKNYDTALDRRTKTLFVVACEGRSEEIYLSFMTAQLRRVQLLPLATGEDGRSAPTHLLERLLEWKARNRSEPEDRVQLWMVLDVDHHFDGRHASHTHDVLNEAARCGISAAITNPRFELWLLLHFEEVGACPGTFCEERLSFHLGGYSHSSYNPTNCAMGFGDAVRRAQAMDSAPGERIPPLPGTRIHNLMRAIIEA